VTPGQLAIIVATISAVAVMFGPILLYLVKIRHEGHERGVQNEIEHGKVTSAVDTLAVQVAALTQLVVEATSELKAHTKWEESQKYASPADIERLIAAVRERPESGAPPGLA
jgi:hypothetical protein